MTDAVQDNSAMIPLPPPEGKLTVVVAFLRTPHGGAHTRMMKRVFTMDAGGGLAHEAFALQARARQMASVMGADLEDKGWAIREPATGDSGEGSPL